MIAKRIARLAVLLMIVCASSAYTAAQQPSSPSPKRQNKIVYDGDMAALLSQLAAKFNVNIGLETDPLQPRPGVKIDLWYDTLDDILNAVVEAAPEYRWRNQDGFIDVYPQKASCPLLDTVISGFQVYDNDWARASEALTNMPEVQSSMEAMSLKRRDMSGTGRAANIQPFSLSLENVTLRRALHEITKKSQGSFWLFQRYGTGSRLFSISSAG